MQYEVGGLRFAELAHVFDALPLQEHLCGKVRSLLLAELDRVLNPLPFQENLCGKMRGLLLAKLDRVSCAPLVLVSGLFIAFGDASDVGNLQFPELTRGGELRPQSEYLTFGALLHP